MKLRELIERVDTSKQEAWVSVEPFNSAFDLQAWDCAAIDDRVKKHWLVKWLCTDTWVGLAVYFLDSEAVATSWQPARKSSEDVKFVSLEAAEKMRAFMLSLLKEDKPAPVVADLDEDMGDHYTVCYSGQLLVKHGMYQGQLVTVVKEYDSMAEIEQWQMVDVQLPDGTVQTIAMDDFHIPYHLKD